MSLTEIETRVIKTCCDLNDKLTLNIIENDKLFVYKSRFLTVDFNRGFIIIDEPSAETPIMSNLVENTPEEFNAEIVDISGGGFSMKGKIEHKPFPLEKGDMINARFRLKPGKELWEIWSEVRNIRKYRDTRILVWGLQFLGKDRNRNLNYYRNKILRYVTERQREILSK